MMGNVATFFFLSSAAPRSEEGIRRVITWPWQLYALAAHVFPLFIVYIVAHAYFHRWQVRVLTVVIAIITQCLWFQFSDAALLRRDYIGKF